MPKFMRSYIVPTPYAAAAAAKNALQAIRDIFVSDLGWALDYDNTATNTTTTATNTFYRVSNRLCSNAIGTGELAQVVLKSPCKKWWILFCFQTTATTNGVTATFARVNAPDTGQVNALGVFFNTGTASELAAGNEIRYEISVCGTSWLIEKFGVTTAGAVTRHALMQYHEKMIKASGDVADASMLGNGSGTNNPSLLSTVLYMYLAVDGLYNEPNTSHTTSAPFETNTVPNWGVMPFDIVGASPMLMQAPIYSIPCWLFIFMQLPGQMDQNIVTVGDRTFYKWATTVPMQIFEIT